TAPASCGSPSWTPPAPPTAWWCGCSDDGFRQRRRFPRSDRFFIVTPPLHPPLAGRVRRGLGQGMVVTAGNDSRHRTFGRSLTAIVDVAVGSHLRAVAVLVVVALLCFLPGFFSIPPLDRDEARFAQATKQMVESGEYVDIRFQDEVRYKKPVGIYW